MFSNENISNEISILRINLFFDYTKITQLVSIAWKVRIDELERLIRSI